MNRFNTAPIWLKIIISLLGLAVIAGVTIFVLILVSPKNEPSPPTAGSDNASKPKIANAQKLLDTYLASNDINDRSTAYKPLSSSPTNTYVQYTSTSRPFGITLTATLHTQYQRTDNTVLLNTPGIVTSTETFLDSLDVKKVQEQTLDVFTSVLFEGQTVACQTDSWQAINTQPATYGLACVDKSVIDSSYKQLAILFKLTGEVLSSNTIKSLTQSDITSSSDQQLTILTTVNNNNSATIYYFVTADKKTWSYVGERSTPSVNDTNSFQLPLKLKEAINSSKFRNFLSTYIK